MIKTRFAPSPTGYLHIGGVRTAIFNWLFAKKHGGQFVLRIDDTDNSRNNSEAIKPILDGLKWIGLNWDEGPLFQSERTSLYEKAFEELKSNGAVWDDNGAWRLSLKYISSALGLNYEINSEFIKVQDLIRGDVTWPRDSLKDPIIRRSDGKFLYNFATVIDDSEMSITHVIRAEEHLSNTPIQLLLYLALNRPVPQFAHIPFVCDAKSKKKLSKRDMAKHMTKEVMQTLNNLGFTQEYLESNKNFNPITVEYYKQLGYLPQALFNYLVKLGWSPDGSTEKFTVEDAIAKFDLSKVTPSSASFDLVKMSWLQSQYMKEAFQSDKNQGMLLALKRVGIENPDVKLIEKLSRALGERLKVFSDVVTYGSMFFREPEYDLVKIRNDILYQNLSASLDAFAGGLDADNHNSIKSLADYIQGFKFGYHFDRTKFNFALRYTLTGSNVGPGIYDCILLMGIPECKARIYHMTHHVAV